MSLPRKLSIHKESPNYNADALARVDAVFVDGTHVPNCVAYDKDAGWAFGKHPETKVWMPRVHGKVEVTEK
jgi:hypothetical protein